MFTVLLLHSSYNVIHIRDISNSLSPVLIGIIWVFINITPKFFPIPWFFHVAIITRYPHYYTGHVKLVFGINIRVKNVLQGILGATWVKIFGKLRIFWSQCRHGPWLMVQKWFWMKNRPKNVIDRGQKFWHKIVWFKAKQRSTPRFI